MIYLLDALQSSCSNDHRLTERVRYMILNTNSKLTQSLEEIELTLSNFDEKWRKTIGRHFLIRRFMLILIT